MKKLQLKQWLGLVGFLVVLLLICLTFMFIVPLESDSTSGVYDLCTGSNLLPDEHIDISKYASDHSFHLLRGELGKYTQAKALIDNHQVRCSTAKLYL